MRDDGGREPLPTEPTIPHDASFLALGAVPPYERSLLFDALVARGGWIEAIKGLVAAADIETLDVLATGDCAVVDLVRQGHHVPVGQPPVGGDLPAAHGSHDLERACRAAAALGAVVVDPTRTDLRDQAIAWYRRAPVASDALPSDVGHARSEVRPFVESLRDDRPAPPFAVALAAHLAGKDPALGARVRVAVLFDAGTQGQSGWLHLVSARDREPILLPDPGSMALFRGDPGFDASVRRSWSLRPGKRSVYWSLEGPAGTIDAVSGGSLGAAFAMALDELHALDRRGQRLVRLRRLGSPTVAVTGDIAPTGRLVAVGGLDTKLAAAVASPNIRRVVVPAPAADATSRVTVSRDASVELVQADDLDAVLHAVRRVDRRAVARASLVVLMAMAMVLGTVAFSAIRSRSAAEDTAAVLQVANRRARLVGLGDRLAKRARDGASTSTDGESLLLAMVADDVYASAGRTRNTLGEVQGKTRAPVRIIRPQGGGYVDTLSSRSERYSLAWTESGTATITDVLTGDEVWSRSFPPGIELDPNQVRFTAAASDPRADLFAMALSTREVLLLVPQEGSVWPTDAVPLNIPSRGDLTELNTLDSLSFAPDGATLVGFGVGTGTFEFDLGRDTRGPDRTCAASDAFEPVSIAATQDGGVLGVTKDGTILRQDLVSCAVSTIRPAPANLTASAIAVSTNPDAFGAVVAGTSGNDLVVVDAKGMRTVLDSKGPYRSVALSSNGSQVTASGRVGAAAWDVAERTQEALMPGDGNLRAERGGYSWIHDGVVEVYRSGIDFSAATSIRIGAIDAALGGDRLAIVTFSGVFVVSLSKDPGSVGPELPAPHFRGTVDGIGSVALSSTGRTGLVLTTDQSARSRTLRVWDVDSGRSTSLPSVAGDSSVNDAQFVGGRDDAILVGYRSGRLDLLRRVSGSAPSWRRSDTLTFDDSVYSFDLRRDGKHAVVLSAGGSDTDLMVTSVDLGAGGLRARLRHTFSRQADDIGSISYLPGGRSVVVTGGGDLRRLSRGLATERMGHIDLGGMLVATPLPGRTSMVLAGPRKAALVSTQTLRTLSGPPSAGPFGWVSSARSSGSFLVTTHFLNTEPRVTVWSVGRKGTRAQACQAVGRDFTKAEWAKAIGTTLSYRPPCRRYLKEAGYPSSFSGDATKQAPLLVRAAGACPNGVALGGHGALRLVRSASASVVACTGKRRVAKLASTYDSIVLDPATVRVLATGAGDTGWYLSVVGRGADGDRTTVVGVQHGLDTLAIREIDGAVTRTVLHPPHSSNSVPVMGLVAPGDTVTIFLPRVEEVSSGSDSSVELFDGFTWPASVEGP